MMSKNQFAKFLIKKYCIEQGLDWDYYKNNLNELVDKIASSSCLAVGLEYLGIINPKDTPDAYNYSVRRGGILFTFADKIPRQNDVDIGILTARELISLLPDELPPEKD